MSYWPLISWDEKKQHHQIFFVLASQIAELEELTASIENPSKRRSCMDKIDDFLIFWYGEPFNF
ncbi:MAG: hypothetical protein OIF51_19385 [Cellvibrionaceae bacterium]|nr:hypothetical protein [Cellvibrionaceae bacterium]